LTNNVLYNYQYSFRANHSVNTHTVDVKVTMQYKISNTRSYYFYGFMKSFWYCLTWNSSTKTRVHYCSTQTHLNRNSVLTQTRFDANRLKALSFSYNFFCFDTRGMRVCVFADKACFYNLICIGYTFCVDSLESCSQTYKRKMS